MLSVKDLFLIEFDYFVKKFFKFFCRIKNISGNCWLVNGVKMIIYLENWWRFVVCGLGWIKCFYDFVIYFWKILFLFVFIYFVKVF